MITEKRIYVIHGFNASTGRHWFPWLKQKLTSDNKISVKVLDMPSPTEPKPEEWIGKLSESIEKLDQDTYFIAHSLGCIALLDYFETLKELPKIGGIIFVSGFNQKLVNIPEINDFIRTGIDYKKIINAATSRVVVTAVNDEIVPTEFSKELADCLEAKLFQLSAGGHFLDSDGFSEFPQIYEIVTSIISDKINMMQNFEIASVNFKNRMVMAPMVPFHLKANDDGSMSEKQIAHYSDFASRGMGLIISQTLSVSNKNSIDGGACVYNKNMHEPYLKEIVQKCHENKVRFFAQLGYPSISYFKGGSINDLSTSEIVTIREEFIKAALLCEEAGCDGIELHGANGFFLNMITSDSVNKRSDQYGGSASNRARLIKEIIKEIKKSLKDDFLISYRFGCSWNLTLDLEIVNELVESGLDLIHVCSGIPNQKNLELPRDYEFNRTVYTASFLKTKINIPVIAVSEIRTMNRGNILLKNKVCDLVAYGRPFLADKNFIIESMRNPNYEPCFNCKYCFWYSDNSKCPAQRKLQNIQ